MAKLNYKKFESEAKMCEHFLSLVPHQWQAYPETGGFDILLSRKKDGFQIGIEAKLSLNAKVITQAYPEINHWYASKSGPDCRAVLIPHYSRNDFEMICWYLGITVMHVNIGHRYINLPDEHRQESHGDDWFEWCPEKRITLPDYIPDNGAGNPCPVMLTDWKIRAIKIVVIIEKIGFVTKEDFKFLEISFPRWVNNSDMSWLKLSEKGKWVANNIPDFRKQHPKNFEDIMSDYENWKQKPKASSTTPK